MDTPVLCCTRRNDTPSWESPPLATRVPDLGDFEAEQGSTPTLHEVKQAVNVAAWEDIRSRLLQAATECNALPVDVCPASKFTSHFFIIHSLILDIFATSWNAILSCIASSTSLSQLKARKPQFHLPSHFFAQNTAVNGLSLRYRKTYAQTLNWKGFRICKVLKVGQP